MRSAQIPSVGVIIPCYNRDHTLHRTLASVLRQTYTNYKIVVVDDGSDNPSRLADTVSRFGDPRIQLIRLKENRGGAAARNVGVHACHSDLIAFLDSDDEWVPTKLERQVEKYKICNNPHGVIYCQADIRTSPGRTESEKIWPQVEIGETEPAGDYIFCNRGYMQTSCLLLCRDLAIRTPFNESLKRHQDYDFVLRLEACGATFKMVPEPLVVVHWEDTEGAPRFLDPSFSLRFIHDYQKHLSPRAKSRFVLQQVVMPLLKSGNRASATHYAWLGPLRWRDTTLVDSLAIASMFLFKDDRIVQFALRLRSRAFEFAAALRGRSVC